MTPDDAQPDLFEPVLPYAGTSGWSGSTTSRERAETDDESGSTSERQNRALRLLRRNGDHGMTCPEFERETGLHHGKASSVLSTLHMEGLIARLKHRRNRCEIYVLPEHVGGRETVPHGRKRKALTPEETKVVNTLRLTRESAWASVILSETDVATLLGLIEKAYDA